MSVRSLSLSLGAILALPCLAFSADAPEKISFHKQIRPIFQANCNGCHQPAKPEGTYDTTSIAKLLKPGESGKAGIVAGKPDESYLLQQITPDKVGKAAMPQGKNPLVERDLQLIRQWIVEGAVDDSPANATSSVDAEHPPVYTRPPVISSIDYSPDGSLIAVAGFHEVLLHKADGSGLVARLIGLAERIESVRFSPDGKQLAVAGGLPGRLGEVQIWDVEGRKLVQSLTVTFDVLYGVNWSPDGKLISFGATDNSVRAFDVASGAQVLFMGSHNDWPRDTVFSTDGSNLISVSRDRTTKLTEVATQRFVDNISSITPGALSGGLAAIARHPQRDEIIIGGADGVPKLYRVFRLVNRVIGDDSNLIREFPALTGRIFSVDISQDGKRIAAASTLDGVGEVAVYGYEFDTALPDDIKSVMAKVASSRNAEENAKLQKYITDGVQQISKVRIDGSSIYSVAFSPDGTRLAAAGGDGQVRLIDPTNGQVVSQFPVAEITPESGSGRPTVVMTAASAVPTPTDKLAEGLQVQALEISPATVEISRPFDYAQLLVTARLSTGEALDVTRMVQWQITSPVAVIAPGGLLTAHANGEATVTASLAGQSIQLPVKIAGFADDFRVDYIREVTPVIAKLGCNSGTCHGSKDGRNGFKLSLRGYDAVYDIRAFTDDLSSRRVNVASPDDSLMLLKSTNFVPHVGGQVTRPGEPAYQIIRNWIAGGARVDLKSPRVASIELLPQNPVAPLAGATQQMRVIATYVDGTRRDVTAEAFIESGNGDVASANSKGMLTAIRRGEAPLLARFEGAYAATTLTVMGDRSGFVWQDPPKFNPIDEFTAAKWQRMKIQPSDLCTDADFIRRVSLDLTGMPPTADDVRAFLNDARDSRVKRDELVDKLIDSPAYVEHWTNKWADLLQVNPKFLGGEGAKLLRDWIEKQVAQNTPYDKFVQEIVTATGSNRENPPASYYKVLRDPVDTMENTTHLFLAVRFNCNKCHDHPFERWTQDQYYETAAYFAQFGLDRDPESKDRNIGGTAVEGAKPLFEIVVDRPTGEVKHDRTGAVTPPKFPYPAKFDVAENASRRQQLAGWMTSPDNQYFAKSYVNRLWGYMFGVGIIDPIDDIRAGNPPTNPELLDYLTQEFIKSGFNTRHVIQLICKSRTYQLSFVSNKWNEDDKINYSHAMPRRLQAESLYDAIHAVTGTQTKFPGYPVGTRAASLPDVASTLGGGFLQTFGKPPRESACECERQGGLQLGPVMALISGPTVGDAIADPNNQLTQLVSKIADDKELINEIFLRILNRPAKDAETAAVLSEMAGLDVDHQQLSMLLAEQEAAWAPVRMKMDEQRTQAIAKAEQTLGDYEKELAPKIVEAETQQKVRIADAEKAVKDYEAMFATKVTEFETQQKDLPVWTVLKAKELKSSMNAKLEQGEDGAIFVDGPNDVGTYTIIVDTELTGVTGVRLEALADSRLGGGGPGRAANGNFVLTEFEAKTAPVANAGAAGQKPASFENAQADFQQDSFAIATAIDGNNKAANNGWAVAPKTGVTHWAVFEVKEASQYEGGTRWIITMHQRYTDKTHQLGKFRLSFTTDKKPVQLGLPAHVQDALAVAADQRTDAHKQALIEFVAGQDQEYAKRKQAVAQAMAPLPTDSKLVQLRKELEEAKVEVKDDPKLVRLRQDVQQSQAQLNNRRLTTAQDLAWALINSPAFLFNH